MSWRCREIGDTQLYSPIIAVAVQPKASDVLKENVTIVFRHPEV